MDASCLLWAALLICSLGSTPAVNHKAMKKLKISLTPPWNRIFKGESVRLTCHWNDSLQDIPTTWTHNNNTLVVTNSSLEVVNASIRDSGEYRCQIGSSEKSNPVSLYVYSGWLLLQVTPVEVLEGNPLFIRCHSWRNLEAKKVIYYKDSMALKYYYENHNLSIQKASLEDSGNYYCQGHIHKNNYSSTSLHITVKEFEDSLMVIYQLQLLLRLLVLILFAVDTGLLILTQRQLTDLLTYKRNRRGKRQAAYSLKSDSKKD
ncbi:high affinity immunoglobulin epsilon receptor subunit alpha isoform X2 [Erinaceus europaeus]|uniref:high affinity immunoglobulin epsilon receptor subunit alpha isoform X2 n=1 Tax=Erinaceus europaeus TaxID=9365 RepID=UPI0028FCF7F3|nr:high affinity immunoglobulin epsilon receptor subunit alpha isoform X2 [Erinaceus europaeus]